MTNTTLAGFRHEVPQSRTTALDDGIALEEPMKLSDADVERCTAQLPMWRYARERGGIVSREFVFEDFAQAFAFMVQMAIHAERRNHHPEWSNVYNRVVVTLTTHDVAGVSMKDIGMALLMDRVAAAIASQAQ